MFLLKNNVVSQSARHFVVVPKHGLCATSTISILCQAILPQPPLNWLISIFMRQLLQLISSFTTKKFPRLAKRGIS